MYKILNSVFNVTKKKTFIEYKSKIKLQKYFSNNGILMCDFLDKRVKCVLTSKPTVVI
jgi:hypothetical protein